VACPYAPTAWSICLRLLSDRTSRDACWGCSQARTLPLFSCGPSTLIPPSIRTTQIFRYTTGQQPLLRSRTHSKYLYYAVITSMMASINTPPNNCTVCANPATTHCAGCSSEELTKLLGPRTPARYCSITCQQTDWKSHKKLCNIAQAQTKLFRTGNILQ